MDLAVVFRERQGVRFLRSQEVVLGFVFILFWCVHATGETGGPLPSTPVERSCSRNPTPLTQASGAGVVGQTQEILGALRTGRESHVLKRFHPRLAVTRTVFSKTMERLKDLAGEPLEFSLLGVWSLVTPGGDPSLLPCDGAGWTVAPHYGFDRQELVVVQVMGQKELARVLWTWVPKGDEWYLGSWHVQQWTVGGGDYRKWGERGDSAQKAGRRELAYLYYDVGHKLLHSTYLLQFDDTGALAKARDSLFAHDLWVQRTRDLLSQDSAKEGSFRPSLAYAASTLEAGGAGLLLQFQLDKEGTSRERTEACRRAASTVWESVTAGEAEGVVGIRCNFLLPGEATGTSDKPSKLGGILVPVQDLTRVKR